MDLPPSSADQIGPEYWPRRLRGGDRDALGPWYSAEYPEVHRLCMGFLASRSEADDLAQDAMLHLSSRIEKWDPKRPYLPWRNALVANLCRDRLRSQDRRQRHEAGAATLRAEAIEPEQLQAMNHSELQSLLQSALRALSPREREVFVLVDLEQWKTAQVAEQLDLIPSSVRAHLAQARRKLRDLLIRKHPELESQ